MVKPKLTVFLVLFLLSLIVILFNQSKPVLLFKNYLSEILRPFEVILSKTGNELLFWQNAFLNVKHLKNLNSELTIENLELYGKLAKLSQLEEENSLLKEKIGLTDKNSLDTKSAKVIGRDFENNRSFLIDKGLDDGIAIGMPVIITGKMVVGKISEVNYSTSKVRTIIDVQSKIAAITSNNSISGLVRGLGSDLILDLIAKNKKPEIKDLVISSGTDGLWPRGLIIGKIKGVKSEDSRVFKSADIELLANFWDFNDVFIIINNFSYAK